MTNIMSNKNLKVLLIIEQCNPEWPSVPLVGYGFYKAISKYVDVTLVTHERNRKALEKMTEHKNIVYIPESTFIKRYFNFILKFISTSNGTNWPLAHVLGYPVYAEFNYKVYKTFKTKILKKEYDMVHAITPVEPRYPVKIIKACKFIPFLLGPVNGGVPFPVGFQETARKEYANLNFLRAVGRSLIPEYAETYKRADKILSGSKYTLSLIKSMFKVPNDKIELFHENGIQDDFFLSHERKNNSNITLLFVGRLVPYKCADVVIKAVSKLDKLTLDKIKVLIVGDGPEKNDLEKLAQELCISKTIQFLGWVDQKEIVKYYSQADVFCFPSIREFGGAVVLEAMASGLPCIVAKNGGIGEYVTEETGFRIEPISRDYLTQELTNKIKVLVENEKMRRSMSVKSIERAQEFKWERKAQKIVEIYEKMILEKGNLSYIK